MFMNLLLFTSSFPYKKGNTEVYLENELPILAEQFSQIFLFPEQLNGELRNLPSNVKVVQLDRSDYSFRKAIKSNWISYLKMAGDFPFRRLTKKYISERLSMLAHCFDRANNLENWLTENAGSTPFVCYSYWCYNWATTLAILKKKKLIDHFVSRAHQNDLYEYMGAYKWIPHRRFQLAWIDRLYLISTYGLKYISSEYPGEHAKFFKSYLGTICSSAPNPEESGGPLQLVSCSNISTFKRVHLIPEIIAHMKRPVEWRHIGQGKEEKRITEAIERFGVSDKAGLLGYMDNAAIKEFYLQQKPDVFLNVSTTEGVPVSIMEAIAAAIPVLATNVGGTEEVVPPDAGWLVEKDFDIASAAALLDTIYEMKKSGELLKRKQKSRVFWEEYFNAEKNYRSFANDIKRFANTRG